MEISIPNMVIVVSILIECGGDKLKYTWDEILH
jgi:hypothetical protein